MRFLSSSYKTFQPNESKDPAKITQIVSHENLKWLWNLCCPCCKLEATEDETPLTDRSSICSDNFEPYQHHQKPSHLSIPTRHGQSNPVPNLTHDESKREEITGAIPKGRVANSQARSSSRSSPAVPRKVLSPRIETSPLDEEGLEDLDQYDAATEVPSDPSSKSSPSLSAKLPPSLPSSKTKKPLYAARSSSDLIRDIWESKAPAGESADKFGSFSKSGSLSHIGPGARTDRSGSMASLYSTGEGDLQYGTVQVEGDIEFGLSYEGGTLEVNVRQVKDLAGVDTKRNTFDTYVKVYLLPDKSKSGKRKTKVKKHTLNPVFDEVLKFTMPLCEVQRRTLWVSVWRCDMFGKNDFLGEVMMSLSGNTCKDNAPIWHSLQDHTELADEESISNCLGDVVLSLKYIRPRETDKKRKSLIMILVKGAKNLPLRKGNTLPDTFCKGNLLPDKAPRGKQKTAVSRKTTTPKWEQTISWDVDDLDDVAGRSLEVTVWDNDRLGHSEIIGGARFNLGTGEHSGKATGWMDATGKEMEMWKKMMDRPNYWVEGTVPLRHLEAKITEK